MIIHAVLAIWASSVAGGPNLLANPGFEDLAMGEPVRWDLYVKYMVGAEGRLDADAFAGEYTVMLHNPRPYDKEPANNWSQYIIGDFSGKTLTVSGQIRCKDATEAAVWVQCWSKPPRRMLRGSSTSTEMPLYGTKDWTPVKLDILVPDQCALLMVRCVLKGSGTAWFDDIEVMDSGPHQCDITCPDPCPDITPVDTPKKPKAEASAKTKSPTLGRAPESTQAKVATSPESLEDTNKALAAQIRSLRDELEQLRKDMLLYDLYNMRGLPDQLLEPATPTPQVERPRTIRRPTGLPRRTNRRRQAPPLVPYGVNWEDML